MVKMSLTKIAFIFIFNVSPLFVISISKPVQAQTPSSSSDSLLHNALPPLKPTSQRSILPENKAYTLDTGDVIQVTVFGLPDQGGVAQVFNDGTVTFPLIGTVNVRGKTIMEVNDLLASLYSRYLKRPSITVILQQPRPLEVAIVGEVNVPGNYNLSGGTQIQQKEGQTQIASNTPSLPKVSDLFTLAGGLTVSADVRQIQLKRREKGKEVFYVLDFWQLLQEGDLAQDVKLKDGDVIIVPKKMSLTLMSIDN